MSFYYPFDSLIRLTDLDDEFSFLNQGQTNSNSNSGRQTTKAGQDARKIVSRPKMDLIESNESVTALVELPGLEKDKVDISLHDNVLTISGKVEHTHSTTDASKSYKSIERSYGSFARSFAVPPGLKEEEIKATLKDGLLRVEVPKKVKESEVRKISIA